MKIAVVLLKIEILQKLLRKYWYNEITTTKLVANPCLGYRFFTTDLILMCDDLLVKNQLQFTQFMALTSEHFVMDGFKGTNLSRTPYLFFCTSNKKGGSGFNVPIPSSMSIAKRTCSYVM